MTRPLRATYRLQFNADFTFEAAARLVPYLQRLGISHVYASPLLAARPGSTHGYDIIDHNRLNDALGGPAGFEQFSATLRRAGLGLILDFVPNHMGIGADNAWWQEVLTWGQAAPCARFFDIDWQPAKRALRGKVLLPILGDTYGRILERGELVPVLSEGRFEVHYHEHRLPLALRDYPQLLPGDRASRTLAAAFARLAPGDTEHAAELHGRLTALAEGQGRAAGAIREGLRALAGHPGDPASFRALHRLLERQHWRLANWRVAADQINYRRFFDINELIGLRVEEPALFEIMHRLVLRLMRTGRLDGLRIDHVDGLFDPAAYCRQLASALPGGERPPPIWLEKILAHEETVPADWPVAGTTGYDFMAEADGLFVDPRGQPALDRLHRASGGPADFEAVLERSKRYVLENLLAGELQMLVSRLEHLAEADWSTRDFTGNMLRRALTEIIVAFPVYRTYVDAEGPSGQDRRIIEGAVAQARQGSSLPAAVLDFVGAALLGEAGAGRNEPGFAQRFQQLTSPVMAKSFEDTAFYRYGRLLALNEVGGDPRVFGCTAAEFHRRAARRARDWPRALLATATHDNKRGEDARSRLQVLTELPGDWTQLVATWSRRHAALKSRRGGRAVPSAAEEYQLYQTLIGSWPLAPDASVRERIEGWLRKALREAKVNSSWASPDEAYETAACGFAAALLESPAGELFRAECGTFMRQVAPLAVLKSLSRLVVKLAAPGVPDFYQGSELWDLSLVDPDNRRPVDYRRRAKLSDQLAAADPATLLADWPSGAIKLLVTQRALALRRAHPTPFEQGGYLPLALRGRQSGRGMAFARAAGDEVVIAVVPRLVRDLWDGDQPWRPRGWVAEARLPLPRRWRGWRCREWLTGRDLPAAETLPLALALETLPVALLRLAP